MITITNRHLLQLCGFRPIRANFSVTQPLSFWLRCLWWRVAGKL